MRPWIFFALLLPAALSATAAAADPISGTIAAIAGTVSAAAYGVGATLQTIILFAVQGALYSGLSAGISYNGAAPERGNPVERD